jgi:WD40 repeat protein
LLPGGARIASAAADGEVCIWDAAGWGEDRARLAIPPEPRFSWQFTPDSQGILIAGQDGRVTRRSARDLGHFETLLDAGRGQFDMLFSSDGRWIASSMTNGIIRVWELPQARLRAELATGKPEPVIWNISEDGNRLRVVGHKDRSLQEWDLIANTQTNVPANLAGWQCRESFPRGRHRRFLAQDVLRHWSSRPSSPFELADLTNVFTGVFTADEKYFSTEGYAGRMVFTELATGRQTFTARGFLQGMHSYAFSRAGRLAVGSDNREAVKLWETDDLQELLTLGAEGAAFSQTSFSPDGNLLGSMNSRGGIFIWRAPSWEEIAAAEKAR